MPTLQFKGKNIIWNHHLSIPYHTLEEDKKLSFQPEKGEGNLIIEGDNLIALKALLPQYSGRIKCIYIDPPYNTGNEGWAYNDKVNSPLINDWFGKIVGSDDLARHDKWLCMMTPRLKLLHDLLSEDGILIMSIDDIEIYNVRSLLNEIFGEDNFVGLLPTIMNLKGNQDEYAFAGTHEYTIVFAYDKSKAKFGLFDVEDDEITDWEEDNYGYFKKGANLKGSGINAPRSKRPNLYYPILYNKKSKEINSITDDEFSKIYNKDDKSFNDNYVKKLEKKYTSIGYSFLLPISDGSFVTWRWQREKVISEPYNIIISFNEDEIVLYKKQRPNLGELPSKKPKSTLYKPEYSSGNGTNQIKELFGDKIFDNVKPLDLIKDLLYICSEENDIILDSFAGTGTTAHAIMDLSKFQKGNRKFILIQMTEATNIEPSKNICQNITSERIKRAIEKYDYNNGFTYLRVGKAIDAESILSGDLPAYKEFAKYIYYLCTGDNLFEHKKIKEKDYYVGKFGNQAIYLIYKEDFNSLTKMALTLELAEKFISANPNKRIIVYAPASFVDQEYLNENQIEFVSIPYNLFQRNK